jgi:hypothetical protein
MRNHGSFFGSQFYGVDVEDSRVPDVDRWKWAPVHGELLNNLKTLNWTQPVWDTRIGGNKTKKPFVLIVAERDVETGALLHALAVRQIPFLAIAAPIVGKVEFNARLGKTQSVAANSAISVAGAKIKANLVIACYWRWPGSRTNADECRWKDALENWVMTLNKKCLHLPGRLTNLGSGNQGRFADLNLARDCGLTVPSTLLSQEPQAIKSFFRSQHGNIILRDVATVQKLMNPKTLRIQKLKLSDLPKQTLASPACFQQLIPSRVHLRAVVVGKKVYCARLEILGKRSSQLDWRRIPVSSVEHTEYQLPIKFKNSILKFAAARTMTLATFDLILSKNKVYFLEMNRPGRWFYLELFAGLPIREAIANELANQL